MSNHEITTRLDEITGLLRQLADATPRLAYSVPQAATMLGGLSESSIYREVHEGRLGRVPHMGRVLIPHDELVRRTAGDAA